MIFRFVGGSDGIRPHQEWNNRRADYQLPRQPDGADDSGCTTGSPQSTNAEIGRCFLRLANLDNGAFDRLSRYETALWRQVGQVIFTLDLLRRSVHSQSVGYSKR
jgi:hypothetical protein